MHRAVILHHTLPYTQSHFDWLIDQPDLDNENRLIAFRCALRPDSTVLQCFTAQRLPDHRAHYLAYEGPVSQDRGSVKRLATGAVLNMKFTRESMFFVIRWPTQTIEYNARPHQSKQGFWNFNFHPVNSPLDA